MQVESLASAHAGVSPKVMDSSTVCVAGSYSPAATAWSTYES